jgi:hypothetical protein
MTSDIPTECDDVSPTSLALLEQALQCATKGPRGLGLQEPSIPRDGTQNIVASVDKRGPFPVATGRLSLRWVGPDLKRRSKLMPDLDSGWQRARTRRRSLAPRPRRSRSPRVMALSPQKRPPTEAPKKRPWPVCPTDQGLFLQRGNHLSRRVRSISSRVIVIKLLSMSRAENSSDTSRGGRGSNSATDKGKAVCGHTAFLSTWAPGGWGKGAAPDVRCARQRPILHSVPKRASPKFKRGGIYGTGPVPQGHKPGFPDSDGQAGCGPLGGAGCEFGDPRAGTGFLDPAKGLVSRGG